jgi:hypothetical protein
MQEDFAHETPLWDAELARATALAQQIAALAERTQVTTDVTPDGYCITATYNTQTITFNMQMPKGWSPPDAKAAVSSLWMRTHIARKYRPLEAFCAYMKIRADAEAQRQYEEWTRNALESMTVFGRWFGDDDSIVE